MFGIFVSNGTILLRPVTISGTEPSLNANLQVSQLA